MRAFGLILVCTVLAACGVDGEPTTPTKLDVPVLDTAKIGMNGR